MKSIQILNDVLDVQLVEHVLPGDYLAIIGCISIHPNRSSSTTLSVSYGKRAYSSLQVCLSDYPCSTDIYHATKTGGSLPEG